MKKSMLVLTFCMGSLGILMGQLTVDPQTYRFPTVEAGEVVTASFSLKNTGSESIEIKSVKTSCGCTTVSRHPGVLRSGQTFDLQVKFRTAGYQGEVTKYVYLYTDRAMNRTVLKIEGRIRPQPAGELQLGSEKIDLGVIRPGEKIERKIKVLNSGEKPLEIIEITHPPFFQVHLNQIVLRPGESTWMTFQVMPTIHGGGMKFIRLKADTPTRQYQWVRISYQVK